MQLEQRDIEQFRGSGYPILRGLLWSWEPPDCEREAGKVYEYKV